MSEIQENIIQFIIVGTVLLLLAGGFIVSFLFLYRNRQRKNKSEKEEMKLLFKQTLLQTQLEIQEQTLKTISQEIHDNIGQVLSLVKLNLGTMEPNKPAELQEKIADSKILVGKAIRDLRDLSKSMNTDNIEALGLERAIEYETDLIRKSGYKAVLNIRGRIQRLEPQKELILFRIIQEVLNNFIKHADATAISIDINYTESECSLCIHDNGKGFDSSSVKEGNAGQSLGMRNMHERAALIGAFFSISSTIGEGTTVNIHIPFNPVKS